MKKSRHSPAHSCFAELAGAVLPFLSCVRIRRRFVCKAFAVVATAFLIGFLRPTISSSEKLQQSTPQANAIEKITAPEVRYRLFSYFGNVWFCDPDSYPVGRPVIEKENALKAFPEIQKDSQTFQAI